MTKEECRELVKGVFGQEAADDKDIVQWYFDVNQVAMDEYAKQKAIAFSNWKDRYMNNPPVGKLASNEQLFDLFNSGVHKEEQK